MQENVSVELVLLIMALSKSVKAVIKNALSVWVLQKINVLNAIILYIDRILQLFQIIAPVFLVISI